MIGIIALSAFLRRTQFVNPITGGYLGIDGATDFLRINILDTHANVTAYWYLMALFLMIYQFFHCKRKLWRITIVLSSLLDLLVIAVSYSRSVRLSMALAFAMLAGALTLRFFTRAARIPRVLIAAAAALFVLFVAYEGSALTASVAATLSNQIISPRTIVEPAAENESPKTQSTSEVSAQAAPSPPLLAQRDPRKTDTLDLLSSGRLHIWRSAFQVLAVKPSVLWKGQLSSEVMTIANTFTNPAETGGVPAHFHNSLLQVLMTTGLPGLLMALAFLFFVIRRAVFLLGRAVHSAPLDILCVALPVIASLPHFLLESCLFTSIDARTLFYFLMCGMLTGCCNDHDNWGCDKSQPHCFPYF